MKEFTDLLLSIENTTKTNKKVEYLAEFFRIAEDQDKVWAIALFTHRRPKRQINTRLLTEWAIERTGIDPWLFEESYHVVGDLSETLALLLPVKPSRSDVTLSEWIEKLISLADKSEEEKKAFVFGAWDILSQEESLVFHKLITGGFRVGVSKNLIMRALAKATDQDEKEIAHRLMGDWDPVTTSYQSLILEESGDEHLSRPYPFYLAYPLEEDPVELGPEEEWYAEWKWDGIRSQLIKRGGELFLWSRGEELITEKFPELHPLVDLLPDGTVIDGELLPYKEGKPLSFALLQTRIGRKNVSKKQLTEAPASIIAYDLMEWGGHDLRNETLEYRRGILSQLVEKRIFGERLLFSEQVNFGHWDQLARLREKSREHHAEGFMIKRKKSVYKVGRKRGDWWKWKVDPYSIDAVMIYAQKGHGRRADIYSDYTFAVWQEDQLVPFAKAYSGLTDKEMLEVTRFVKANTVERFGPVRTVKPELVFEIHFEGIAESNRHKSGVAVRFPRIHRWRHDKKTEEANTIEDLKSLLLS